MVKEGQALLLKFLKLGTRHNF